MLEFLIIAVICAFVFVGVTLNKNKKKPEWEIKREEDSKRIKIEMMDDEELRELCDEYERKKSSDTKYMMVIEELEKRRASLLETKKKKAEAAAHTVEAERKAWSEAKKIFRSDNNNAQQLIKADKMKKISSGKHDSKAVSMSAAGRVLREQELEEVRKYNERKREEDDRYYMQQQMEEEREHRERDSEALEKLTAQQKELVSLQKTQNVIGVVGQYLINDKLKRIEKENREIKEKLSKKDKDDYSVHPLG